MTREELIDFWSSRDIRTELRKTAMMGIIGLILAFIAPYDTSNMPESYWRLVYWVGILLLASVISGPIGRLSFPHLTPRLQSPAGLLLGYSVILSVPIFLVVIFGDIFFTSGRHPNLAYATEFLARDDLGVSGLVLWFGQVEIITFMALGSISLINHATRPKATSRKAGPPPGYLFLRRLPVNMGQDLLCLQMEDHYVRAYTDKGDTLVRMRLKDAVAELDGYDGLQVHRSWWVATQAIETVKKDGRRHLIYLKGGRKVPVSKTFEDGLRTAGYL